jgi:hypothetical protein
MRSSAQARKAAGSVAMETLARVVFIVSGYQNGLIFKDQPLDLAQILRPNPAIPGERIGSSQNLHSPSAFRT